MPRQTTLCRILIIALCLSTGATSNLAARGDHADVLLGDTLIFQAADGRIVVLVDSLNGDFVDLPNLVFHYRPVNPENLTFESWRGVAEITYRTGGLFVAGVDEELSFLFNIDRERGFAEATTATYALQGGVELSRTGFTEPDQPTAEFGVGRQLSSRHEAFITATLTEIQASPEAWPGSFLEAPPTDKLWGVCSAGGEGATECSLSCPGGLECSVTCGGSYFACCVCLGPQPICQCEQDEGQRENCT